MGELSQRYNELLEAISPPKPLQEATLDTPQALAQRDEFFNAVRRSLETRLSALAIDSCITVERIVSPDINGQNADTSDELMLDGGDPIAFALQTREHALNVVRFGIVPVNRHGEHILAALEEADQGFSDITFR